MKRMPSLVCAVCTSWSTRSTSVRYCVVEKFCFCSYLSSVCDPIRRELVPQCGTQNNVGAHGRARLLPGQDGAVHPANRSSRVPFCYDTLSCQSLTLNTQHFNVVRTRRGPAGEVHWHEGFLDVSAAFDVVTQQANSW